MDMDIKILLDKGKHVHVKINFKVRMHTSLEKNLCSSKIKGLLDFIFQVQF